MKLRPRPPARRGPPVDRNEPPAFLRKRGGSLHIEPDEIIVDCFAGGGGASLGIEWALGRKVDIAINHDPDAVAMHKVNHPETEHYIEDVKDVDPVCACRGRRVGLAWFSPDCTEHSRAKNGAIVRDKKIRGLADIVITWARLVRPRVIMLENVQEWWDWGPLDDEGTIDKLRKGEYRAFWWSRLEAMGYRLSMRILKACDYGAPTSRTRLFIIARCDGIDPAQCWPESSHGPNRELPYRTAAECIDYSIPCPSIFMTRDEATEFTRTTGIKCKRPLADKTMQRIRRGLFKYVINCAKPFTIRLTGDDPRVHDIDEPARTVTAANRGEMAFVSPHLVRYNGEGDGGGIDRASSMTDPVPTVTTANRFAVVAPTLIQTGYGERPGQDPRCLNLHEPMGTVVAGGGRHAIVQSRLERVASFIYKGYGGEDSPKRTGGFAGAGPANAPMSTITCRDHNEVVVSNLVKLRGTSDAHMDASSLPGDAPVPTISAHGNHVGEVRAFLTRYNGTGEGQLLDESLGTVTTHDRFGLVTIEGTDYQIVDIGMRMLEPRELYRAQGFPDSYIIDPIVETVNKRTGKKKRAPLSKTGQVDKCGNSVPPPVAAAIVRSVFSFTRAAVAA